VGAAVPASPVAGNGRQKNLLGESLHSRLPGVIWLFVTVLSMAVLGSLEGLSRSTRSPAVIPIVLMFATVLTLIADLDRPGEGTLQLGSGMMIDLERQMKAGTIAP
jgi:hypothetical protein